tara:strand:- start:611 stop:1261 length:651 start_codon:yes stop_codon:yes gene_type:complete
MNQFKDNYELSNIERKRVQPLLNQVLERSISFKYFITIPYHHKQTNYNKVIDDNRFLKLKIRRFFKEGLRMIFFVEKHTNPSSKHYLGYHRHILLENIPNEKWISPTPCMKSFLQNISPDALLSCRQNNDQCDLYKEAVLNQVIRLINSVPNGLKGLDVRSIHDLETLLGYCTKQSGLILPASEAIDIFNSDIDCSEFVKDGLQKPSIINLTPLLV